MSFLHEGAAKVIGRDSADRIDFGKPLMEQGFDSLMAVEYRNFLGKHIGRSLPVSLLFNYPAINDIVDYFATEVLDEFFIAENTSEATHGGHTVSTDDLLGDIESMLQ